LIAKLISSLFNINNNNNNNNDKVENKVSNEYLEIIYLFNPFTISSCARLKLTHFYVLVTLVYTCYNKTLFGTLFLAISIFTSPGFIFTNLTFFIYNLNSKNYKNQLINLVLSIGIIAFIINFNLYNLRQNYFNYFTVRDSLPNIGVIWSLILNVKIIIYNINLSSLY
jgi:hypothetical protein